MQQATAELEQFLAASFNGFRYYDCQFPKCLLWSDSTPRGITNDSRQTWIWFMRLAEGFYLRPVSPSPYLDVLVRGPLKVSSLRPVLVEGHCSQACQHLIVSVAPWYSCPLVLSVRLLRSSYPCHECKALQGNAGSGA